MLKLHPNDNAREGSPGVWIFRGKSVVLLVIGVAAGLAVFKAVDGNGVLLAIFSDDELLWFRVRLSDEGLHPEGQKARYRLIEAITNELIERGLIK